MKRAVIISAGSMKDYSFFKDIIKKDDFIICADGGLSHANKMNIKPNLIVGDFDSYKDKIPDFIKIKKFETTKDYTDTQIAVDEALKRGFKKIILLGVIGSRIDHTLANIQLLKKIAEDGGCGKIIDENNSIMLCSNEMIIRGNKGEIISLLPMTSEVLGVTLYNFKYPLKDYDMKMGNPIGISNVLIENEGKINIKDGLLLVIKSKD